MKQNIKFFSISTSLLLISSLVLTGCMYAIASSYGEVKPYNLDGGNTIVEGDAPIPQDSLRKKFEAMYDISADGKSITAISEEYLSNFWDNNYEKEIIHSLSTEEVYFIIQDSIRIYFMYDKIILPECAAISSNIEVAKRFAFVEEQEIFPSLTPNLNQDKIKSDIHVIIMYRLAALSSTKAFFTGEEAIHFAGYDPNTFSGMYPDTLFYIPSYSANTDREYILSVMGGATSISDLNGFPDLFAVSVATESVIDFISKSTDTMVKVYPTVDMFDFAVDALETNEQNIVYVDDNKEEFLTPYFKLYPANDTFEMILSTESAVIRGTYVCEGDALILYPLDGGEEFQYVFYCIEERYDFYKGESIPIPGYEFEDGQIFYITDSTLVSYDNQKQK